MLTRNCAIEKLLNEGDFNVRVTIYDATQVSKDPEKQKAAWLEAIRDSLGGGIIHDMKLYSINLRTADRVLIDLLHVSGWDIVDTILKFAKTPQPIRITLKTSLSTRVWIIV